MNFEAILLAIGAAYLSHNAVFRVGKMRVSAFDTGGAPVHFTFSQAFTAAELGLAGQPASVQIGDVKIVADAWPTP